MNNEIHIGDLVMIVRGHKCTVEKYSGMPFTVSHIAEPVGGGYICVHCGELNAGPNERAAGGFRPNGYVPLSWLKKIPPLSEPETTEEKETVKA